MKKIESDDEKISNLIKRRLPLELTDIHYEKKDSDLEIIVPEKIFLLDGLQIIKRGIVNDISKFIPVFKTIVFVEKYSNPGASADNITTPSDSISKVDNDNSAEPNQNSEQIKDEVIGNGPSAQIEQKK